jgi:hypothetical protein
MLDTGHGVVVGRVCRLGVLGRHSAVSIWEPLYRSVDVQDNWADGETNETNDQEVIIYKARIRGRVVILHSEDCITMSARNFRARDPLLTMVQVH